MTSEKTTALYEKHVSMGAKILPFAGFLMPIQYTGIVKEHEAVRAAAGIFDVSHMGTFILEGENAEKNLENILTNSILTMKPFSVRYTTMCYENGGVVDDLLVYCFGKTKYMLVVNASNIDKDFDWIKSNLPKDDIKLFKNTSNETALIAVQGPKALELMKQINSNIPEKFFTFKENVNLFGADVLVSTTGYTGEDGVELYFDSKHAELIWDGILKAGEHIGLLPCGLGARDTLRLEASLPLYGHEISKEINPLEAGLTRFVKLDKPNFIGKPEIEKPLKRRNVGLKLLDKGIAREGTKVFSNKPGGTPIEIGFVTSGTMGISVKASIAMALIDINDHTNALQSHEITLDVRGKMLKAEITELPFYKK